MMIKLFLLIFFPTICFGNTISYYQGYLMYKNYIKDVIPSTDINEVIAGIKDAHNGVIISRKEIDSKKKEMYEKAKEERLAQANNFMKEIVASPNVIELEKGKLAYKVVKNGFGLTVKENDSPSLLFVIKVLENGEELTFTKAEEPTVILLRSTIPGFVRGVTGMSEGEKRIIYIHPDLAYGSSSEFINPNTQIIVEVEVVKI